MAINNQPKELTFGRIVRRLPLYFGLALAGLVFMTLVLAVSIHFKLTGYLTGGWIGFAGYTSLLFWVIVRNRRPRWYCWNFWILIVAMLIAHCFVFVTILRVYPEWRMIWFWPIIVVEAGAIGSIFEWVFPHRHEKHRRVVEH